MSTSMIFLFGNFNLEYVWLFDWPNINVFEGYYFVFRVLSTSLPHSCLEAPWDQAPLCGFNYIKKTIYNKNANVIA